MADNTNRSPYIVFEGIDGTGKSTQVKLLAKRLGEDPGGWGVQTWEPFYPWTRELASEATSNDARSLIYEADRSEWWKQNGRALESLQPYIIQDRSFYSTLAYQDPSPEVRNFILRPRRIEPDLIFLLDMPAIDARERTSARGELDGYEESVEFQEAVRWRYRSLLCSNEKAILIDARQDADTIADFVSAIVKRKLATMTPAT